MTGNRDDRVSGMLVTRVEKKERRSTMGAADLEYADDITTRVKGCMTTIVGKHDKKRSWVTHAEGTAKLSSLDGTEVSSEGELVLRVGKSSIRMKDGQIGIQLAVDQRKRCGRWTVGFGRWAQAVVEGGCAVAREAQARHEDRRRGFALDGEGGQGRWAADSAELPRSGNRPAAEAAGSAHHRCAERPRWESARAAAVLDHAR